MSIFKKKIYNLNFILLFLFILVLLSYFTINKFQKDKDAAIKLKPITINLLTSVHPNLSWNFKPIESKILIQPGDITTVEYLVENLGNIENMMLADQLNYLPNDILVKGDRAAMSQSLETRAPFEIFAEPTNAVFLSTTTNFA